MVWVMKKHLADKKGEVYSVVEDIPKCVDDNPEHGGDFCDSCGDCLVCHTEDPCPYSKDGEHYWVVYD